MEHKVVMPVEVALPIDEEVKLVATLAMQHFINSPKDVTIDDCISLAYTFVDSAIREKGIRSELRREAETKRRKWH